MYKVIYFQTSQRVPYRPCKFFFPHWPVRRLETNNAVFVTGLKQFPRCRPLYHHLSLPRSLICDTVTLEDDPEDILSASLQSLYGLSPITFSAPGSLFTYTIKPGRVSHPLPVERIEVATPDTEPSNWALHASSIWVSSLFVADHLEELQIDTMAGTEGTVVRVLELGAGAGLPSVLLASMYPNVSVTVSDYPDDRLIRTLSDNIRRNRVSKRCRAIPYAWGTDTGALMVDRGGDHGRDARFDLVFAADTLWNPELHAPFLNALSMCLKHGPDSRIHLVAGLHTGRYTIQSFLDAAKLQGLVVQSTTEREVGGTQSRPWDVSRAEGEDERERRRWVVWMILKWEDLGDVLQPLSSALNRKL